MIRESVTCYRSTCEAAHGDAKITQDLTYIGPAIRIVNDVARTIDVARSQLLKQADHARRSRSAAVPLARHTDLGLHATCPLIHTVLFAISSHTYSVVCKCHSQRRLRSIHVPRLEEPPEDMLVLRNVGISRIAFDIFSLLTDTSRHLLITHRYPSIAGGIR
jgi:hypothetical protein